MTERIANVTNDFDSLCNICIEVLEGLSQDLGMSYGELNVCVVVCNHTTCYHSIIYDYNSYTKYYAI